MLEIVRFKDFSLRELVVPLHDVAKVNRGELIRRYSPGTAHRLGSNAIKAKETLEQALFTDKANNLSHSYQQMTFAIVHRETDEDGGRIVGAATAMAGLDLNRLRIPLPPVLINHLSFDWARTPIAPRGANITGWTSPAHYGELNQVYEALLNHVPVSENAWTIEPLRAPDVVHDAILSAGLQPGGQARYELPVEDSRVLPPVSQFYIRYES